MIIKEGSTVTILNMSDVIIDKIKVSEDIEIENEGNGYTFLLRNSSCKENCIFESDKIYKKGHEYFIEGVFKDAILVIQDREEDTMHESYMDYDN